MHAGTWRVGDDNVRPAVFLNERVIQNVLHVAGIEQGVLNAVDFAVHLGVLNSLGHILDADDLTGLPGHEVGDGARAGVEVVD